MNKFTAMSIILSNEVMHKQSKDIWVFVVNGISIGLVSKSDGKYFAHYKNRKTSLQSFSTFMAAAKELIPSFLFVIENYNSNIETKQALVSTKGYTVVKGNKGILYIKHDSHKLYKTINLNHNHLVGNLDLLYPNLDEQIKEDICLMITTEIDNVFN